LLSSLLQKDYGLAHLLTALISKSCKRRARLRSAPAERWQGKAGTLSFSCAASSGSSQPKPSPGSTDPTLLVPLGRAACQKGGLGQNLPHGPKPGGGLSVGQDQCKCFHGLQWLGLVFRYPQIPQI